MSLSKRVGLFKPAESEIHSWSIGDTSFTLRWWGCCTDHLERAVIAAFICHLCVNASISKTILHSTFDRGVC